MPNSDLRIVFELSPETREAFQEINKKVGKAFVEFSKVIKAAFDNLKKQFGIVQITVQEAARRDRGEGDERGWLSYMCGAWLCGSCPNPELTACAHKCHGGDLK